MSVTPRFRNRDVRRLLIQRNALAEPPGEPASAAWVREMTQRLSFVQVDSVAAVTRAQHQILLTRHPRYRREHLREALEQDRTLFEGWTHDAAVLPVTTYPYWRHYFDRERRFEAHPGYRRYFAPVTPGLARTVLRRIDRDGPLRPREIDAGKAEFQGAFASPSLAKLAMEFLWRTGKLAVCHRDGRGKVYDLVERVIPEASRRHRVSRRDYVEWSCREALARLGAATAAEIAAFFHAVATRQARQWCEQTADVIRVQIERADGSWSSPRFALASLQRQIDQSPAPPRRLRLLNPFDPLIHDRKRTRQVFGFDYSLEIWVPPARRKYGYYVMPMLERDRFVGRLDAKLDRRQKTLTVVGLWWEPGVEATRTRRGQLDRELERLARFCGAELTRR